MRNGAQKVIFELIETLQLSDLALGCLIEARLAEGDRALICHLLHKAHFHLAKALLLVAEEPQISQDAAIVEDRAYQNGVAL